MGGTRIGALVRQRADHRTELSFYQRPVDRPGRLADPVINLSGLHCLQDFQQGRLVQGHRVLSFRENHWRGLADHHTVAPPTCSGTPSGPITYTTGRDATARRCRIGTEAFVARVSARLRGASGTTGE